MTEELRFEDRLTHFFDGLLVRPNVRAVFAGWDATGWGISSKALITLVSPTFEGMRDQARQEMVWSHITERLSEKDLDRIEFIYTKAPSELREGDPRREPGLSEVCANPGHNG